MTQASTGVPFREAVLTWLRIGLLSFGGPAGQIALMHRILVEEKGWLEEQRFLHALNYCMLLPGPEAQQLATYTGWLLHGVRGGLVAGLLFVLPGALAIFGLSLLYFQLGSANLVEGLFFGLKAAVLAIVLQALWRIAGRALAGPLSWTLAGGGFVSLFVFGLPFPLVVLGAGLIGYLAARLNAAPGADDDTKPLPPTERRPGTRRTALVCLLLWGATVAGLIVLLGGEDVFSRIAGFFSVMAVVSFGGAYAVLAYVAQQAVEAYQWLQPGEMLDGLGLAETTPGPLILVTQFVGFLAAAREAGFDSPWLAGGLGALLTTWVTFLPCFVWIFLGAPYVEKLRGHRALSAALAAITAAVVGVIANLALWFSLNFLFSDTRRVDASMLDLLLPVANSVNGPAIALALVAVLLVFAARAGIFVTLAVCAGLGIAGQWLF